MLAAHLHGLRALHVEHVSASVSDAALSSSEEASGIGVSVMQWFASLCACSVLLMPWSPLAETVWRAS
jgi:hypothetical protein